jgi:hypothetical protein
MWIRKPGGPGDQPAIAIEAIPDGIARKQGLIEYMHVRWRRTDAPEAISSVVGSSAYGMY